MRGEPSTRDTDALIARNQREVPLLRLPGELRNKIYALVLGGLVITSSRHFTSPEQQLGWKADNALHQALLPAKPLKIAAYRDGEEHIPASMSGYLALLRVCSLIHDETRLLPFEANIFELCPSELSSFIDHLSVAQRDAITTFRAGESKEWIDFGMMMELEINRQYRGTTDATKHRMFHPWEDLHNLAKMKRLTRVVIGNHGFRRVQAEFGDYEIVAKISEYTGSLEVEIVFDDLPIYVG
ncbi:hypothetical protein FB567DRAFT_242902 [Paraphoma chrysanthemicola]|uniref:Uncharacterized protein n=1 Tax=Paraphoma chrysanthemicola TaxID=798071 RepID=A0A8K0VRV3_9PLEO|nr:hypothetical protein FB567DRAFT_242902 [Paraphoma chrysanthemicola]